MRTAQPHPAIAYSSSIGVGVGGVSTLRLEGATFPDANGGYQDDDLTERVLLPVGDGVRARVQVVNNDIPSNSSGKVRVFFEIGDQLGSASFVVDMETGELVERATYEAFGRTESDYRPDRWNNFRETDRYTGHADDAEVGVVYFGARYYSPLVGRWLSPDPLAVHTMGGDMNAYAFVGGSPMRFVDRLGLEGVDSGSCGFFCAIGDFFGGFFGGGRSSGGQANDPSLNGLQGSSSRTGGGHAAAPTASGPPVAPVKSLGLVGSLGSYVQHSFDGQVLIAGKAGLDLKPIVPAVTAVRNAGVDAVAAATDTPGVPTAGLLHAAGLPSVGDLVRTMKTSEEEEDARIYWAATMATVFIPGVGEEEGASLLARWAGRGTEVAEGAAQGVSFRSFSAFKRALGVAGEKMEWHHIVEQTEANLSRFGAGPIHNTGNLIRVDRAVHQQISGFYSSIQPFSGSMTVRRWLATQSFAAQQQFGLDILARFGVVP